MLLGGMLLFLAEKKDELRKAKQEIADSGKELEAAKEVCVNGDCLSLHARDLVVFPTSRPNSTEPRYHHRNTASFYKDVPWCQRPRLSRTTLPTLFELSKVVLTSCWGGGGGRPAVTPSLWTTLIKKAGKAS